MSNKYKFTIPSNDTYINLPIEIKWDFYGRDDSIDVYEDDVLEKIIGIAEDFEILRFSHQNYDGVKTDINYNFNFYSGLTQDLVDGISDNTYWSSSYLAEGFSSEEVYYYRKPFTKSFFKLDFYDSNNEQTQINYFTVILPIQQGYTEKVTLTPFSPDVNIKIPTFKLDYVGDKEGFYLYWLRKKSFLNINPNSGNTTETFYMTAKFFDAKIGVFVKMMNQPQSSLYLPFTFLPEDYFYYKVTLDYVSKTYQIFDTTTGYRIGTNNPITWYEYVNPA